MDAKVRDILAKVKESAEIAGRNASKVANDLVTQAKLNLRIVELNSEVEAAYKNLGKMLYAVHTGVEIPADAIDDSLMDIDGKTAEIEEIREALQKAKVGTVCPVCGKNVGKKAAFCSACGAKIERPVEEPVAVVHFDACDCEDCCDAEAEDVCEYAEVVCEPAEAAEECCCDCGCTEEAPAEEPCCCEACEDENV